MVKTDSDLRALVTRARDPHASLAERQEAFGAIVERFRDFVFACAYARLRDRSLAEDASQDAFLVAWTRLAQLRQADALPGWIRRLVLTQCHRRLRARRLEALSDADADSVPSPPTPAGDADHEHKRAVIDNALARLTPGDRLVLTLFHGCDRSHKEIARWLGVPATTVARRLSHARKRLSTHVLDGGTQEARTQPRPGRTFLIDLADRIRQLHGDGSTVPARAREPVSTYLVVAPGTDRPRAFAAAKPTIFRPIFELQVAFDAAAIRECAADAVLMHVVQDVTALRAVSLQYRCSSKHQLMLTFLQARGFHVLHQHEDWLLDTRSPAWLSHTGVPQLRLEFRPLAALSDPTLFTQALELVTSIVAGRPGAGAVLPVHPDTLHRTIRAQQDGVVALDADGLVGFLGIGADDGVPLAWRMNAVAIGHTARRESLATALLQEMLVRRPSAFVRCLPSPEAGLSDWLARCGFEHLRDELILERLLRDTVTVPVSQLDEYTGEYVVAGSERPMPPITIERHGGDLVSKAHDMRDVLLAASDTEFFTRHHDAHGRFERDETGRVARLIYTEGPREFVAIRR